MNWSINGYIASCPARRVFRRREQPPEAPGDPGPCYKVVSRALVQDVRIFTQITSLGEEDQHHVHMFLLGSLVHHQGNIRKRLEDAHVEIIANQSLFGGVIWTLNQLGAGLELRSLLFRSHRYFFQGTTLFSELVFV